MPTATIALFLYCKWLPRKVDLEEQYLLHINLPEDLSSHKKNPKKHVIVYSSWNCTSLIFGVVLCYCWFLFCFVLLHFFRWCCPLLDCIIFIWVSPWTFQTIFSWYYFCRTIICLHFFLHFPVFFVSVILDVIDRCRCTDNFAFLCKLKKSCEQEISEL